MDWVLSTRLILLGVFGSPQGVRGELRLKSYTGDPIAISRYGALTDKSGARRFVILAKRALKADMLVVRLEGVVTRDAAAALTGVGLFARREQLPPPGENEFYFDDLIGLTVATRDGTMIGKIIGVENYGAGDIIEIAPVEGGETLLAPFSRSVALDVDFAKRCLVIDMPRIIDGEFPDDDKLERR